MGVERDGGKDVGLRKYELGAKSVDRLRVALAPQSKLEPMVNAANMVKTHLDGILNAVVLRTTNAAAESMNARIQRIKRMACGYRNRARFRNAILFHLGGLKLYPKAISTHSIS